MARAAGVGGGEGRVGVGGRLWYHGVEGTGYGTGQSIADEAVELLKGVLESLGCQKELVMRACRWMKSKLDSRSGIDGQKMPWRARFM
jgi:hypothetical protein